MSFLELSLYTYESPVLYAAKRKAILKTGLFMLIISVICYILFSGAIVTNNLKKTELVRELNAESRVLEGVRSELVAGDAMLTIDYLGGLGYKETKNLNILKRTNNVADNNTKSYQQNKHDNFDRSSDRSPNRHQAVFSAGGELQLLRSAGGGPAK